MFLDCQCHPKGSLKNQCDYQTGQCQCAQRVQGKKCHQCLYGYWNINSGVGCNKECACDPMGAYNDDCDDVNGQCRCKQGIGGLDCSYCLPGFWGFSPKGCTSKGPSINYIWFLGLFLWPPTSISDFPPMLKAFFA